MISSTATESREDAKSKHLTLTVRQLAERMQVSMPTAYAMTEQEGFPVFRVGKKILIPLAALEHWLDMQVCGEMVGQEARDRCRTYKTGRN